MKNYNITLTVKGPLFVGSGQMIGKKEYAYDKKSNKFYIPDMRKFFRALRQKKWLMSEYENYLLNDSREFYEWLRENHLARDGTTPSWAAYTMNGADIIMDNDSKKREIKTFIKDAYGSPYVPGSSIKGMLRTAILSVLISRKHTELARYGDELKKAQPKDILYKARRVSGELEDEILRTLNRKGTRKNDAVNDTLSGLIVGDSKPIAAEKLILCQKIDLKTDGKENRLPLVMECLPPGTQIEFSLTIDEHIFKHSIEDILVYAKGCRKIYKNYFENAYPPAANTNENGVYIGGNCGYPTKTIAYALMYNLAVGPVSEILNSQFSKHNHKPDKSIKREDQKNYGVSPHTLKCTRYKGALYEMGLCEISAKESE